MALVEQVTRMPGRRTPGRSIFSVSIGTAMDPHLIASLKRLPEKVALRAMNKAMKAATRPVIKQMKVLAPKDTGTLRKSLGVRVRTYKRSRVTIGVVGPRNRVILVGDKRYNAVKYAHLVEFGTKPHVIQPRHALARDSDKRGVLWMPQLNRYAAVVKHPGRMASGFMRRAWQGTRPRAFKAFGEKAWEEITKEIAKLKR